MRPLFPNARSPTAVPFKEQKPFARMLSLGNEQAAGAEFEPCELLVPWAGTPENSRLVFRREHPVLRSDSEWKTRDGALDLAITNIGAAIASAPGFKIELLVSGKVVADIDANYLEHLWPRTFRLAGGVMVGRRDWLVIRAPSKCGIVLCGIENWDDPR